LVNSYWTACCGIPEDGAHYKFQEFSVHIPYTNAMTMQADSKLNVLKRNIQEFLNFCQTQVYVGQKEMIFVGYASHVLPWNCKWQAIIQF
jgi:hypothetical protein